MEGLGQSFCRAWCQLEQNFGNYLSNSLVPVFSHLSLEIIHWPFSHQSSSLVSSLVRH